MNSEVRFAWRLRGVNRHGPWPQTPESDRFAIHRADARITFHGNITH
jgi:hypothetical protein